MSAFRSARFLVSRGRFMPLLAKEGVAHARAFPPRLPPPPTHPGRVWGRRPSGTSPGSFSPAGSGFARSAGPSQRDALRAALPEASSVWRCAPPPGPRICEVFSPLGSPAPRVAGRGWPLLPPALWARLPPVSAVWGPSCGLTFASPRSFSGTSAVPGLWERILRKLCLLLITAKTQHEKLLS